MNFYKLALTENISIDNEEGMAKSYNDIGKVYTALGDIDLSGDSTVSKK